MTAMPRRRKFARAEAPTHECPVAVCSTQVRDGLLMCPADWAKVPKPLQREVNATWTALRRALIKRDFTLIRDRRVAYEFARKAAIASAAGAEGAQL